MKEFQDILIRLQNQPKINGALQKDIEDAIKEINYQRHRVDQIYWHLNEDKDGSYFLTKESYNELFVLDQDPI